MTALSLAIGRIQEAAESIRTISMDLRPSILDDLGVVSALQWFCRSFAEIYPSLEVAEDFQVKNHEVPDRLATVIYRCAQEMLHNVAKHAAATRVEVRLTMVDRSLDFQVRDNGTGNRADRARVTAPRIRTAQPARARQNDRRQIPCGPGGWWRHDRAPDLAIDVQGQDPAQTGARSTESGQSVAAEIPLQTIT